MSVIEQALRRTAQREKEPAPTASRIQWPVDRPATMLDDALRTPTKAEGEVARRIHRSRPPAEGIAVVMVLVAMGLAVLAVSSTAVGPIEEVNRAAGPSAATAIEPSDDVRDGRTSPIGDAENNPPTQLAASGEDVQESPAETLPAATKHARENAWSGRFRVTGIISGAANPYAVINGAMVAPGQSVDGAHVVAIDRTAVRVRVDGREIELQLNEADVETGSSGRVLSVGGR
ncbi:MAG: hypothetical protein HOP29_09405 [Phycisphaerales bacterium]|nr:hypothetical protein [Phycisphaerales bacterium]